MSGKVKPVCWSLKTKEREKRKRVALSPLGSFSWGQKKTMAFTAGCCVGGCFPTLVLCAWELGLRSRLHSSLQEAPTAFPLPQLPPVKEVPAPLESLLFLPVSRLFLPILGQVSPLQVAFSCLFWVDVSLFIYSLVLGSSMR